VGDATKPLANSALLAYTDTLDGRSDNRYFYRAAFVDAAHNQGALSPASPPVYLPKVVPPRAPSIIRVFAGDPNPDPTVSRDRKITLVWASNREPALKEYRLYRADNETNARDIRLMTPIHTKLESRDPTARPAEVMWTDMPLAALVAYYYRVVSVDDEDNVSDASSTVVARAYDQTPPSPPTWVSAAWNIAGSAIDLVWSPSSPDLQAIVLRRNSGTWGPVSPWLPTGLASFSHSGADSTIENRYRLRVRSEAGNVNITYLEIAVAPL
jgi:hypothetical protein